MGGHGRDRLAIRVRIRSFDLGLSYEGEFLDGRQHGYGMFTKADGDSPDAYGFTVQVDMDENLPIQQPSPFGFLVWGSVNRSASKLNPVLSCLGSARSARCSVLQG